MVDASHNGSRAVVRQTRDEASPGDVAFLLRTVRHHKRTMAVAAFIGLGLGFAAQITLSKRFAATEQLVLDYSRLVNVNPQEAVLNFRLSDAALDSQTEILTSDGILGRTVDALKLADDPDFNGASGLLTRMLVATHLVADPAAAPVAERREDAILVLRKAIKAERLGLSYVIEITASAKTAAQAVAIANGLTDAYIADQLDARRAVANGALDWFETRLHELQANVTEAQHKAIEYRLQHQIMLADGRFIDEQQVQDLSSRLVASQERRFLAEARLSRADAIVDGKRSLDGVLPGSLGDEIHDPVIVGLLNNYHDVSRRMQQNLALYGPTHEAVVKDQTEMRSLQDNILSQFKQIAEGARSDADIAASEQTLLTDMLKQAADRAAQAQTARVELTLLQGAADSTTALRDTFVLQYSMSTQQQTFPITETRVTSRAILPFHPVWPTPRKTLLGGLAIGLIAGFAYAVGDETLSRRLRKRSDLEAATGRRCLGYLPFSPALGALGRDRPVLADADGENAFASDALRAMLLDIGTQSAKASGFAVGLVGTAAGDGATTAAAAAASTAAAAGRRVLLVDADPRRGSLSTRYAPAPDAAADPAIPPLVWQGTGGGSIRYAALGAPAGPRGPGTTGVAALAGLVDRLRPAFDLIVVDCPPLTAGVDARAMAEVLDGYILTVRWNGTMADAVIDCLDANPEVDAKLLGSLFSRISLNRIDMLDDAALSGTSRTLALAMGTSGRRRSGRGTAPGQVALARTRRQNNRSA